jgi:predicted nuclease of predicted toxin-antitoxin system
MNLLLDECVPRRLKRNFVAEGYTCSTVQEAGLAGKTNGELLSLAERRFQVLITLDKGLPHQQNLSRTKIAVLLIRARSNRVTDILPRIRDCLVALQSIQPGDVLYVGAER